MKSAKKTSRCCVIIVCIGLMLTSQLLPAVYAEDFWEAAKAYSNSLGHLVTSALQVLSDAKDVLEAAELVLADAKCAIGAAGSAAVVGKAMLAVTAAEGAVAGATTALGVATLMVASWVAGTAAGQAIDYGISQIWDPICPIAVGDTSYIYPTNSEVDSWIPNMILGGTNVPLTRVDFDNADTVVPGLGTASWNFMREGTRGFAIAMRGAGAYTAGRCGDVQTAANDLQALLPTYTASIEAFAGYLATTPTFTGDPMAAITNARLELNALEAGYPWNPTDVPDPAALVSAINLARLGLNQAEAALQMAGDGTGNPLMIDGGMLAPLTLLEFVQWLENCRVNGAACLPPAEVAISDYLVGTLGVTYDGVPSINAPMAAWDGLGDTGNEASLFNAHGGSMTMSEVLTTAIANHWNKIDLSWSPLIQCGSARILQHPANTTASYGSVATFTVRAAGDPVIIYRWKKNSVPLNNGTDISGAYTPTLQLNNVQLTRGVQDCYTCAVSNGTGGAESNCAALTVPCFFDIPGDFNKDCVENMMDLAKFTTDWLSDSSIQP
jgi:hypothetical protein